jgi:hypothetical protein
MAFRSMPDFAIHCTAGIIGEAGSVLSRREAKARPSGAGAMARAGEAVLRILDEADPLANLATMR